ncbi:hypothetical protein OSB04_un000840 [Centaurea solstitialis]|uniref:Uncharacterized protein n=1 Tax=Centaurea solstitialis TaxID=347529 RepID=A0AA38SBT9_9ASTR|nr:hypothetical protein OSB04_un000840 [Centaurea solstitialis]
MSPITPEIRASAEIITGHDVCKEKIKTLLKEFELPSGLMPLEDIEELGRVKDTGLMWVKQKKSILHKFEKAGKTVQYGPEITGYVEKRKIKKMTGSKSKELFLWIGVTEIVVDGPPANKITIKTTTGISQTFPKEYFDA